MSKTLKIAIVVQQCGVEVLAGAERYALNLGLALANAGCEVKILTSQSADYQTWTNTLTPHEWVSSATEANARVEILRFANRSLRRRTLQKVAKAVWHLANVLQLNRVPQLSLFLDRFFLWAQGPWCPALWQELARSAGSYDLIIFKSYLYAPAFYGLQACANATKTLFIPAAHPEPTFHRPFVGTMLERATALGFVSNAEKELVEASWPFTSQKETLLLPPGLGNEWRESERADAAQVPVRPEIRALQNYFLVLGRLDKGKNLELIFRTTPAKSKVVFAGAGKIDTPHDDRFVFLGRVSETEKKILLQNAIALLSVSKNEAFSMTTAEAMAEGCPVIGWSESKAVCELMERFGGSQFRTAEELRFLLEKFKSDPALRNSAFPNQERAREELSWKRSSEKVLSWMALR